MDFNIELYVDDDTGERMVYISANDGASGAEYPYDTPADIGLALQTYIENYYSDIV